MKYEKMSSDEVLYLQPGFEDKTLYHVMNFACCDCGMVHKMYLSRQEKNGCIAFAAVSWPRATAQLRRNNYGFLQQGIYRLWKLVRRRKTDE